MARFVVFDLDGTLLDTVRDIADAANYALTESGFPTLPVDHIKFSPETAYTAWGRVLCPQTTAIRR